MMNFLLYLKVAVVMNHFIIEGYSTFKMTNRIYPWCQFIWTLYFDAEMLVFYHFMWICYHFGFETILWCNLLWLDLDLEFDWLCGCLGELVSRLDLSLLVINQMRIQLDIGDWLNRRFFIKRTGSLDSDGLVRCSWVFIPLFWDWDRLMDIKDHSRLIGWEKWLVIHLFIEMVITISDISTWIQCLMFTVIVIETMS